MKKKQKKKIKFLLQKQKATFQMKLKIYKGSYKIIIANINKAKK